MKRSESHFRRLALIRWTIALVTVHVILSPIPALANVWQRRLGLYDTLYIGVSPTQPGTVLVAGGDYYCCGLSAATSANRGLTWNQITPGPPTPDWIGPVAISSSNPPTFYVNSFQPNHPSGIFRMRSGEAVWSHVLDARVNGLAVAPGDPNRVYALADLVLYVSNDAGTSWQARLRPLEDETYGAVMVVKPDDPDTVFVGVAGLNSAGGTYRSRDGGRTWTRLNGLSTSYSIEIDPSFTNRMYATTDQGLYRSLDGGDSWATLPPPQPTSLVPYTVAIDWPRNTIYLGTYFNGVFRKRFDADTWTNFSNGLFSDYPENQTYQLAVDSPAGVVYAGTYWGLYSRRIEATAVADFDGDGRSDVSVFRPSDSTWYVLRSADLTFSARQFGLSDDRIVPGDYDGDRKTDLAVYRKSTGTWYIAQSTEGLKVARFGMFDDTPAVGDFDGDERTDLAVFRKSSGDWWFLKSRTNEVSVIHFGTDGDLPVVGDYDADGTSDFAIYRRTEGNWYLRVRSGYLDEAYTTRVVHFGLASDEPAAGDYDLDGKTDVAVYRGSEGRWYIQQSRDYSTRIETFGGAGDVPAPGDYDGDERSDIAIFRGGEWWVNRSTGGITVQRFGLDGDIPIPAAGLR